MIETSWSRPEAAHEASPAANRRRSARISGIAEFVWRLLEDATEAISNRLDLSDIAF
ncbi:MAG: hypothetical protein ABIO14_13865 [Aeromicrobium sp.]